MARWKNFRGRARAWGGRAKAWASKRKSGLGVSGVFLAGTAVGLTDYDKMIPYETKIIIACLPSGVVRSVPQGSVIQNFVRGLLIGDMIQQRTGINLAGAASGTQTGSFGV